MTLTVDEARAAARHWVLAEAETNVAIMGAFYHGSVITMPDAAEMPPSSDVDVMVLLDHGATWDKPGKFTHAGALLEISTIGRDRVATAEAVLGEYNLAGSFRYPGVIFDRDGTLTGLQAMVGHEFARRRWVRRRCEQARDKVVSGFPLEETDGLPVATNGWLFPAGVTTHILLVAGLRNPTVRKRYQATRELLTDYGQMGIYGTLMDLLGASDITPERAGRHLDVLAAAFDAAAAVIRSPFPFAADISGAGRAIAIGGTDEMIREGDHREAMFWLAATFSRCLQVLHRDAPEWDRERFDGEFRDLLADLGIGSFADMVRRRDATVAALPAIWAVAEAILAANPEIRE